MAQITQTELIAAGGYVNLGQPSVLADLLLGARTYMMYANITGMVNPGYVMGHPDASGYGGPRFQLSSTSMYASFVTPTTTQATNPYKASLASSLVYGSWANFAVTWEGGSSTTLATNCLWYKNGVLSAGPNATGTSLELDGTGIDFMLFNRPGLARPIYGSIGYNAAWDRVLTAEEIAAAVANGPLSISDGLILCWSGGQDYGPYGIEAVSRSTFAAGSLPPNLNLGTLSSVSFDLVAANSVIPDIVSDAPVAAEVAPVNTDLVAANDVLQTMLSSSPVLTYAESVVNLIASDSTIPTLVDSSPAVGSVSAIASLVSATDVIYTLVSSAPVAAMVGESMEFVCNEDAMNISPTLSSITNPTSDMPVMNLSVRVIYSVWRQLYFKLLKASGKRPSFSILNPSKYVNTTFNSNWRPWYSYDGINWLKFDTAPVNNTTTWDWQNSAAFTSDTVYVAFMPAHPLWRSTTWLIAQLQALNSSAIHELTSAPGFVSTSLIPAQTDELGNTVAARPQYGFKIEDTTKTPADGSSKRIAVITGGMHAGEHLGSFAMEYFCRFILSGNAKASTLLQNFVFHVYPCINPMGRVMGHYRGQRDPDGLSGLGSDPNRDWLGDIDYTKPMSLHSSLILAAMIQTDLAGRNPAFHIDFHGTWGGATNGNFFYYGEAGVSTTPGYFDNNAIYVAEFTSYLTAYKAYGHNSNDVYPDSTLRGWMSRMFGAKHDYISETYEQYPFTSFADICYIGTAYASAVSDIPLSQLVLPTSTFEIVSASDVIFTCVDTVGSVGFASTTFNLVSQTDIITGVSSESPVVGFIIDAAVIVSVNSTLQQVISGEPVLIYIAPPKFDLVSDDYVLSSVVSTSPVLTYIAPLVFDFISVNDTIQIIVSTNPILVYSEEMLPTFDIVSIESLLNNIIGSATVLSIIPEYSYETIFPQAFTLYTDSFSLSSEIQDSSVEGPGAFELIVQ